MIFDTELLCKPEATTQKAIKFLQDENLQERLSRNALKWAKRFNWEQSAEEFLRVIGDG